MTPILHATVVRAFDYDIAYRYYLLDVVTTTVETARRLATDHALRAYDAVQLATAYLLDQELRSSNQDLLTFICADDRLLAVAQAEGLLTDNPNHHP